MSQALLVVLESVADRARAAGVFGDVSVKNSMLVCAAKESAEPAEYRVFADEGKVWVSLVTANRWLSESIETDLLHTGDKLDELIEEEMIELGYKGQKLPFQHYRSDDKLFTFRTTVPVGSAASLQAGDSRVVDTITLCLLAYEACFRQLGDIGGGDEE